ncbi:MAG: LexA family transcriptional regulator [Arcicella sp.]|nr:LexA family transcriptional regulator [Arcicella sp.]
MDTYFSQNLRFLRKNQVEKTSQEKFAEVIEIKKPTLGSYESGRAEPKYADLIKLANYYQVNIGDLLTKDLSTQTHVQKAPVASNLRVLATTVNSENEDNIEFVPIKAVAGYVEGYGDLEFIETLPVFQVPFLQKDKKYRVFPIQGESMLPLKEGSYVFAEYIEDWRNIKNGTVCVIVTKDEGIVLKKVFNYLDDKNLLVLKSTNERFAPYPVMGEDINELWKFAGYFQGEFPS